MIFFLSHQPGRGPDELLPWLPGEIKNLLHIPTFGLLTFLIWHSIKGFTARTGALTLTTLSLVLIYACLDEWHQSFIPGRTSSFGDIINDLIGALLAITITAAFHKHYSDTT